MKSNFAYHAFAYVTFPFNCLIITVCAAIFVIRTLLEPQRA